VFQSSENNSDEESDDMDIKTVWIPVYNKHSYNALHNSWSPLLLVNLKIQTKRQKQNSPFILP
jgi:hypothetical protein